MRKIFFIIILIFTTSCGYVPVYLENNTNTYNLNTINFSGDRIINRELVNFLNRYKNNKASKNFNLEIISSKSDTITAKDKKGNPVNFNKKINIVFEIEDIEDEKKIQKTFERQASYKFLNDKFETNQYERGLEKNLIDQIKKDIIIYMNLLNNDL
jgi:ABC-type thiamine transport system substrate-binding protein